MLLTLGFSMAVTDAKLEELLALLEWLVWLVSLFIFCVVDIKSAKKSGHHPELTWRALTNENEDMRTADWAIGCDEREVGFACVDC
jgi:hypothetical protein